MIATATEGWRALYTYSEGQSDVVISRAIAVWILNGAEMIGWAVDDLGNLLPAHSIERFVCYCAPDDEPMEILKRRAADKGG